MSSVIRTPIPRDPATPRPRGWPSAKPWGNSHWMTVAEARRAQGVRITDSPYWAALWAQCLQGVLDVKRISYRKVVHPPYSHDDPLAQQELYAWTAQTSVPTMVYGDGSGKPDIVRNDWLNQLMLAEEIQPEPSLIPRDAQARVLMVGLSHEIMSPQGLMWNARLCMRDMMDMDSLTPKQRDFFTPGNFLGGKYSHNAKGRAPLDNIRECMRLLDDQLARNQATGSQFFLGDALSALDIYWAYASNMASLLPHEAMPVMTVNRNMYGKMNEALAGDLTDRLLEHRERILREHLTFPVCVD